MYQSVTNQLNKPYETDLKHFVSKNLFQVHKAVCFESKPPKSPIAIKQFFAIWTTEVDKHPSHVNGAML